MIFFTSSLAIRKLRVAKVSVIVLLIMISSHVKSQNPSWMYWDPWNALIPSRIITSIEVDHNGIKWLGTEPVCGGGICTDGGLAAFDGENWTVYDSLNSSLNSNFIEAVAISPENIIWAGTGHGEVSSFDGSAWQSYPFPNITSNASVTGISIDLYGYIWATTEGNGLFMWDGIEWTPYNSSNSILSDFLRSIETGPDNSVWTGGTGNKIFKYTGSWNEIILPAELFFTSTIAIDHENRVWIGSDGVFCNFYAGEWTVFDQSITGIPDSSIGYVFDITFDLSGNTWIGHSEGLIKYDGSEWTTYLPENSGMLSRHVMSLAADELGNMWIGTADTGLIAYHEAGVVGISEIRDQRSEIRNAMLKDPYPNPSTSHCMIRFELHEDTELRLEIIDISGRQVRILDEGFLTAGTYNMSWDRKNERGNRCQNGIYFIKMVTMEGAQTMKLILQ